MDSGRYCWIGTGVLMKRLNRTRLPMPPSIQIPIGASLIVFASIVLAFPAT